MDVSIRPGRFYHANEDTKVKIAEQLFEIYLSSVGRGSTLLLNIQPDQRGLFHEKDIESLKGYKRILRIDPVITSRIRINISDSKACPLISNVEIY